MTHPYPMNVSGFDLYYGYSVFVKGDHANSNATLTNWTWATYKVIGNVLAEINGFNDDVPIFVRLRFV